MRLPAPDLRLDLWSPAPRLASTRTRVLLNSVPTGNWVQQHLHNPETETDNLTNWATPDLGPCTTQFLRDGQTSGHLLPLQAFVGKSVKRLHATGQEWESVVARRDKSELAGNSLWSPTPRCKNFIHCKTPGGKIWFISDKACKAGMQVADLYDLSTQPRYIFHISRPCLWLNLVKLRMNEAIGSRSCPRPALIVTLFLC